MPFKYDFIRKFSISKFMKNIFRKVFVQQVVPTEAAIVSCTVGVQHVVTTKAAIFPHAVAIS